LCRKILKITIVAVSVSRVLNALVKYSKQCEFCPWGEKNKPGHFYGCPRWSDGKIHYPYTLSREYWGPIKRGS